MPIEPCKCEGGGSGRRWGESGKCYCGKGAASKAGKQAAAAYAHGYAGEADDGSGPDALGGRFTQTVRRLLELCREGRRERR